MYGCPRANAPDLPPSGARVPRPLKGQSPAHWPIERLGPRSSAWGDTSTCDCTRSVIGEPWPTVALTGRELSLAAETLFSDRGNSGQASPRMQLLSVEFRWTRRVALPSWRAQLGRLSVTEPTRELRYTLSADL